MSGQRRADGRRRPVRQSLEEYARGVVGGLLFSLPLIYTMEVWWAGFIAQPEHLLLYLAIGFLLLFGYNRYAGLRQDASWREVAFEAVEEMGLGLVVAAGMLWLLDRLNAAMPPEEILGKVVVEGVTAAIGVSVGGAQLSDGSGKGNGQGMKGGEEGQGPPGLPAQLVLATCGAVLFASNVAPTEEILMIAVETSPWKLLGLVALSLLLGGVILFQSDFRGSKRHTPEHHRGTYTVTSRTMANYAVALVTSAFILWFFGRFEGMSPGTCVAQTVVLSVASSIGAAAGRLLLQ